MVGLFLIAHEPLASAMRIVGLHTYPEAEAQLAAYDVPPDRLVDPHVAAIERRLAELGWSQVLLLTDVLGATPANITERVARAEGRRALAGLNVPMLWRVLNYRSLGLDEMAVRARDGGTAGVHPVNPPGPQNQAHLKPSHDPQHRHHQQ